MRCRRLLREAEQGYEAIGAPRRAERLVRSPSGPSLRLSAYPREVRNGEVVLVTDRGQVVAELRQPSAGTALGAHERALERLAAEGVLLPGLPQDPRAYRPSPLVQAIASSDLLDAERGER